MKVKALKNILVNGIHHWAGSIVELDEKHFATLKERGHVEEVTNTPQAPANPQEQPAQTQEEGKAEETASNTESSEAPANPQEPSEASE